MNIQLKVQRKLSCGALDAVVQNWTCLKSLYYKVQCTQMQRNPIYHSLMENFNFCLEVYIFNILNVNELTLYSQWNQLTKVDSVDTAVCCLLVMLCHLYHFNLFLDCLQLRAYNFTTPNKTPTAVWILLIRVAVTTTRPLWSFVDHDSILQIMIHCPSYSFANMNVYRISIQFNR